MNMSEILMGLTTLCCMGIVFFMISSINTQTAVTSNVTYYSYSAFNMTASASVIAPFIGVIFWASIVYVLLYKRNMLGKLLLGYAILIPVSIGLVILYIIIGSLPAILGMVKEGLEGLYNFIYGFFFVTGDVMVHIPSWIYGIFIVSLPIAYVVGDFVQKWNAANEANERARGLTANEN